MESSYAWSASISVNTNTSWTHPVNEGKISASEKLAIIKNRTFRNCLSQYINVIIAIFAIPAVTEVIR